MARLEDLTRGAQVKGIRPDGPVEGLDAKWHRSNAPELTYKAPDGKPGNEHPFRDREASLEVTTKGPAWSFDADGTKRLERNGEVSSAELLGRVGSPGDIARDFAHQLYTICDRRGWAQEAGPYNALLPAWPELTRSARQAGAPGPGQRDLFGGKERA